MKEIPIVASPRRDTGKGAARRARREGKIPAVVYGPEVTPQPIEIDASDFRRAIKASGGESTIFNLQVDGKENKVIVREMQRHPVTSQVTHVDLHAIAMNKPINIALPIHFVGTPYGVKTEGGVMQTTMRELDISCLPKDIPERFELDVSELKVGDAIHVSALSIPNVEILDDPQRTVVVISAPTVAKATAAEEAAAAAEAEAAEAAEAAGEAAGEEKKEEEKTEKSE